MRALLLIAASLTLLAQQPPDPTERLVRARDILVERRTRLPDYVCVQTVNRRYFKRRSTAYPPPGCDRILSLRPDTLFLEATDRLRLDLKVSHGLEIGSWPGSRFTSRNIFDLVGVGPYGTGMMGPLISDIFVNGGATYRYQGEEIDTGTELSAYTFQVPVESSHYLVKAGSSWPATAFSGSFWLDSESFELKRLMVRAHNLPSETEACAASTDVAYEKVHVAQGEFLLPRQSSMRLVMQDESETEIAAVYSGCREYHGEATIHFGELPASGSVRTTDAPVPPLPAGLQFSIALTAAIDTNTAAAGDVMKAKLRRPIRDPQSKTVLVPAGAIVLGRIVQMQHWLTEPHRFKVSIVLEQLEVDGVARPLYATLIRQNSMLAAIAIPAVGLSAVTAAFVFPTNKSHYRVPAGYESQWKTIDAPGERK